MQPILAALPEVEVLFVSLDEALQLVPLDALVDPRGELVGSAVRIHLLVSLLDLLHRAEPAQDESPPCLVAFGGIDYGEAAAGTELTATNYPFLRGAEREVRELAELFHTAFPVAAAEIRDRLGADKDTLFQIASGARYLHLATHGYFARESARPRAGSIPWSGSSEYGGATELSPLVLCGLALSGANLAPDELGHRRGIVTAEELLQLDLAGCRVVVLSACETSVGVRRAGQGHASLRAALLGAGARCAVTSLWTVGDDATRELMVDFYRRMWKGGSDPHTALWEARTAARASGAPFRDWAGWILTGS
jgi:CHAT domain-containing protein